MDLYKAICENPEDNNLKLVYADWLEENGGDRARAELIRLQAIEYPDANARGRIFTILKENRKRWTPSVNSWTDLDYQYGFPHIVIASPGNFLHSLELLKKEAPTIVGYACREAFPASNNGSHTILTEEVENILEALPKTYIHLDFSECEIDNDILDIIINSEAARRIKKLYLTDNAITDLTNLARSKNLVNLEVLDLRNQPLNQEDCETFYKRFCRNKKSFPNIKELYVDFQLTTYKSVS